MLPFKITRRNAPPATPRAAVSAPTPTSPAIPVRVEQKSVGKKLINIPLKRKTICNIPIVSTTSIHDSRIFIIGGVNEGGSYKFINEFIHAFPQSIRIQHAAMLNHTIFSVNDVLFIQHLIGEITCDMITHIYDKYKCRVIISIHDYYYISKSGESVHNAYLLQGVSIPPCVVKMFSIAELIIYPSQYIYNNYKKYFPYQNFIICPHIDYTILSSELDEF